MSSTDQVTEKFDHLADEFVGPVTTGVERLLRAWQAGQLDTEEFQIGLVQVIMLTNAHCRGWADAWAAALLRELDLVADAVPLGSTGVSAVAERDRLLQAAATVVAALDSGDDVLARLQRLAAAEPVDAAQQQLLHTFNGHGVDGYTRGLDAGACELCRWLYKDGYVYPTDKSFHRHPGCRCAPIPTKKG